MNCDKVTCAVFKRRDCLLGDDPTAVRTDLSDQARKRRGLEVVAGEGDIGRAEVPRHLVQVDRLASVPHERRHLAPDASLPNPSSVIGTGLAWS